MDKSLWHQPPLALRRALSDPCQPPPIRILAAPPTPPVCVKVQLVHPGCDTSAKRGHITGFILLMI